MITIPEQHDIDREGKRLLRETIEPLKWVVNDVQEDYGIDSNVQVFDERHPTGAWFHVQLKSSKASKYSANGQFVSQELTVSHARHYALEMRDPVFLVHVDAASKRVYWHAPQVDRHLMEVLQATHAEFITVRMPTNQQLPATAPDLLTRLNEVYLVLGSRTIAATPAGDFAETIANLSNQEETYNAFQEKANTLKVQRIFDLFHRKQYREARTRADLIVADPETTVEVKFWAQMTLQSIDFGEILHAGRPQKELSDSILRHAKKLQRLTNDGPNYLKFYSLIARHSAELEVLCHEEFTLFITVQAHLQRHGSPMLALGLYARRSVTTRRIFSKYNQCVRLARYAATHKDRWMLGRALATIPRALGPYMVVLRTEGGPGAADRFWQSAQRILKVALRICHETGDRQGVVLCITSALSIAGSTESDAYLWTKATAESIIDQHLRSEALTMVERAARRWKGEPVEGDYEGDTVWQAIQNIATALGIDLSNEQDPLVRGLKIAAKDDSPERVLAHCEHLLVTQGAIGPVAREVQVLFNTSRASSKVIHCTLHNFHVEARELDTAYDVFKSKHCDSCPDMKPRPEGWRLTAEEEAKLRDQNVDFVSRLFGTPYSFRFTDED